MTILLQLISSTTTNIPVAFLCPPTHLSAHPPTIPQARPPSITPPAKPTLPPNPPSYYHLPTNPLPFKPTHISLSLQVNPSQPTTSPAKPTHPPTSLHHNPPPSNHKSNQTHPPTFHLNPPTHPPTHLLTTRNPPPVTISWAHPFPGMCVCSCASGAVGVWAGSRVH